jgi:ankyrin repeat protein
MTSVSPDIVANEDDVNRVLGNFSRTMLHRAYDSANLQEIELLLAAGARADAKDAQGAAPWYYAACNSDQTVMAHVIATGVDVNATDSTGKSLLHRAAAENTNAAVVAMLVNAGADVTARDRDGNTPCHCAALNKNVEVMRQLISLCDINAANNAGDTPCILATKYHNHVVLESLVRAGANVHAVGNDDLTAFAVAVHAEDDKSLEILVDANADVNIDEPGNHNTALHVAVELHNHRLIAKLIAAGANLNATNECGDLPFHMLRYRNSADAECTMRSIALLMAAGADVNTADPDEWTPLHIVVRRGLTDCVSLLLEAGADIEAEDCDGASPLFGCENAEVAAMLIAANADLNHVNCHGRSACHYAGCHPRVLALLIAAGANPHVRGDNGETALHCAAEENNCSDAMSMLINAGADVNQADNDGNCAAHWAARAGRVDNLKFLLEHGAQFNQRNNAGKTVLGVAAIAHFRTVQTMRWLLDSGADIGAIDITAAHGADSSALLFLRSLGVNLNDVDKRGNTACHHVRDREAFEVLFAIGAVSAVNHNGQTPFEMHCATVTYWSIRDDLVLSFAAAGHCCGVACTETCADILIAGGGRVSAEADTDRLLERGTKAIDQIFGRQKQLFRLRAWQVCIGLQSLRLSALELCEILAHMFAPLESLVPFHIMWKVVLAVKHFVRRQPPQELQNSRWHHF